MGEKKHLSERLVNVLQSKGFIVYCIFFVTKKGSICYYVKHNKPYRPFILLEVVKNAVGSAERRKYLFNNKASWFVFCCQCFSNCCDLLIVAFHIGEATTLHASC